MMTKTKFFDAGGLDAQICLVGSVGRMQTDAFMIYLCLKLSDPREQMIAAVLDPLN